MGHHRFRVFSKAQFSGVGFPSNGKRQSRSSIALSPYWALRGGRTKQGDGKQSAKDGRPGG